MGCLKRIFVQVGCLILVLAAVALGIIYREQATAAYRRLRGLPPVADAASYAAPTPDGAARAAGALRQLSNRGGPAYVDLTAEELAALVDREFGRGTRRVFDSIGVALGENTVRVRGVLDVSQMPRQLLGPLASGLGRFEPVAVGGPLAVDSAGRVLWTITSLKIRDFPFPRGTIPAIIRALRIPGATDGSLALPMGEPVGDVRVSPERIRVYRAAPR
ncbi:MAG: hypothetical protein Q7J79_00315 [Gemmatimonadales bacterium]|nr:hypothetical protein [Gemmatimonadales bacterium]